MSDAILQAARHWPAPIFVALVAAIACFSTAGIPIPITAALLLAGALAAHMPHGLAVFVALVAATAISMTARDVMVLVASQRGARFYRRWRPATSPAAPAPPSRRQRAQAETIAAAHRLLSQHGWLVLFLSRFTIIASPIDIAAGSLGFSPRRFVSAIAPGRLLYVSLLLGLGALTGQTLRAGANLSATLGALGVFAIALIVIPSILSQRVLARARRADAGEPRPAPASRDHA